MKDVIIGIDPGANGAVAVSWHNGNIEVFREKKYPLEDTLAWVLEQSQGATVKVFLEKVQAMPGQGVSTMFTFGVNFGRCIGSTRALKFSLEFVRPQQWQKGLGLPTPPAKATPEQRKRYKAQHKKDLVQLAKDLFPAECKTADCADALLIMRYGLKNS